MQYVRFCEGLTAGKLIPANIDPITKIKDFSKDHYISIFQYTDEQYNQWKATKSISGIREVTTNKLFFDFDNKDNIDQARKDTITLVSRLQKEGIPADNIQISFTGNKGFSVQVETDKTLSQPEFKSITFKLASELESFDKVVNDPSRITRVVYTKHPKSGLYKTPISINELVEMPIEAIKDKAKQPNEEEANIHINKNWVTKIPDSIYLLKDETKVEKTKGELPQDLDMSLKPKYLSEAKYALQCGYFESGERHEAMMILAATYRAQGMAKEITYRLLKGVAELQARRTNSDAFPNEEIWNNVVYSVYDQKWSGAQYGPSNPLLMDVTKRLGLKTQKENETPLVDSESIANIFKDFATSIDKNTIKFGIPDIDKSIRITTSMLVGLLAGPGVGKTSTSFTILNSISKAGIDADFYSLDMGSPLVFQRLIQKHHKISGETIFDLYKNNSDRIQEFEETLKREYKNVRFCFRSGLTVEDIRTHLTERKEKEGKTSKLLVIDYLECLQGPYSDSTANTALIAQQLKDLANDFGICVLLLLQPQKSAGSPADELLSYRNIKGSSAIEQACSIIFTMWRPGFDPRNPEQDKFLSIAVVKNRMGICTLFNFHWSGLSGEIRNLTYEEEQELEAIVSKRKLEKEQEHTI